jgi:hypothetical protein
MSDLISKLSEIRSEYNCFDEDEEPYYRALSEAIRILSKPADEDTISRQATLNALCTPYGILYPIRTVEELPSAQSANSSKISYSVICEKFPNPHIYFNTYDEAEHWARFNQPNYRPYYIIKRSEHFEIVGEAK